MYARASEFRGPPEQLEEGVRYARAAVIPAVSQIPGYKGAIDIEGWHDPVYRDDLEMSGQVHALNFLKKCRGGAEMVPNPN